MDETLKNTLIIWAAFAIVFGPFLTRSSIRRSPVRGGVLAHLFHFIAATAAVAVVPTIIAALVFGGGFRLAFPLALTLMLTSLFSLVIFAIIEKPAIQTYEASLEDRGWTEEDARTSGL
jgi:hypothetical protein